MATSMQADYPKKLPTPSWDTVNVEFPVRKFPETDLSSTTLNHDWRGLPEIVTGPTMPLEEIKNYYRDYNLTRNKMQSEYTVDYRQKHGETNRHNKHTSCTENNYINFPSRRLTYQPPQCRVHGTSEMRAAFTTPTISERLVTDKDQYKHPFCLDPPPVEPSYHKDLEPLDTTYEGFEKYLDPYLTTSRLHHRPYTAGQLETLTNAKNVVTYYTLSNTPMTRTPQTKHGDWRLALSRPKSMYDREKFKEDRREVRTHNTLKWVPGTFRTEVRDNFSAVTSKAEAQIHNYEEEARSDYYRALANLATNIHYEHSTLSEGYKTEYYSMGAGKPLSAVFDQYPEKNKRLELREMGFVGNRRSTKPRPLPV